MANRRILVVYLASDANASITSRRTFWARRLAMIPLDVDGLLKKMGGIPFAGVPGVPGVPEAVIARNGPEKSLVHTGTRDRSPGFSRCSICNLGGTPGTPPPCPRCSSGEGRQLIAIIGVGGTGTPGTPGTPEKGIPSIFVRFPEV